MYILFLVKVSIVPCVHFHLFYFENFKTEFIFLPNRECLQNDIFRHFCAKHFQQDIEWFPNPFGNCLSIPAIYQFMAHNGIENLNNCLIRLILYSRSVITNHFLCIKTVFPSLCATSIIYWKRKIKNKKIFSIWRIRIFLRIIKKSVWLLKHATYALSCRRGYGKIWKITWKKIKERSSIYSFFICISSIKFLNALYFLM